MTKLFLLASINTIIRSSTIATTKKSFFCNAFHNFLVSTRPRRNLILSTTSRNYHKSYEFNYFKHSHAFISSSSSSSSRSIMKNNINKATSTTRKMSVDNDSDDDGDKSLLTMENIYTEWTLEDDQILYQNINQPIHKAASILGRGLNGVSSRIQKLKDVSSSPYKRLFVESRQKSQRLEEELENGNQNDNKKLVPVIEVMRRIKWDHSLQSQDFIVNYFDRVDERILSCPFDQPNNSVKGKEESFIFAIPEHRIMSIQYKERVVWDKEQRLDCVFGSMNGNGETIQQVIQDYDGWVEKEKEKREFNERRRRELVNQLKFILGDDIFLSLKTMSQKLQEKAVISTINDQEVADYVKMALSLFRKANLPTQQQNHKDAANDDDNCNKRGRITDVEALNLLSDLVALLPNDVLREQVLLHVSQLLSKFEIMNSSKKKYNFEPLQLLNEDELTETFVRGSGAGGQKINKTASKVVLVHKPTQIRVECQDTRSLQQNRKIARKRMKFKLDQHFNGASSRVEVKAEEKKNKKARVKARNKARQRKKKEAALVTEADNEIQP